MKRRNDFLLREVAARQVIVPLGRAAQEFPGMLSLNATGAYLWQLLEQEQTEDSLVEALCQRYAVDEDTARKDVTAFVNKLRDVHAITEE